MRFIFFLISLFFTFSESVYCQNSCLIEDRLEVTSTSLGSPLEGPYLPGEFVTFSYSILNYRTDPVQSGNQCQWLQGVVPVFGNAWSQTSFFSSGRPRTRSRPSSIWQWFLEDSVRYNFNNPDLNVFFDDILDRKSLCYEPLESCANGSTVTSQTPLPAGWFVTTEDSRAPCENAGEDPNDSWGIPQACGTNANHGTFTFTLQVRPYDDDDEGCLQTGFTDASVSIYTFTDAEVGCFVGENTQCAADAPAQWSAEVRCVPSGNALRYYNQSFPVCDIEEWSNLEFQLGSQPEYPGHEWPGCDAADSLNFPNWFTFVAQEDDIDFDLIVEDCFDSKGVRWSIFEIPCRQNMGLGQGTASVFDLGDPLLDCSSANTSIQGEQRISFQGRRGQLYGLLLEGVDNDICSISFEVNHSDELPNLSDTSINGPDFDATAYGFVEDTVCLGAENVEFSTDLIDGGCAYQWTLRRSEDPGFTPNFITDQPSLELDFPIRDEYELCVRATNYCDTTSFACSTFIVAPGANSFLKEDTICQGASYTWVDDEGELIREIPPQNEAGLFRFSEFLDNDSGCNITANLDLLVQRVNEDDPTVIDTFICYEQAQAEGLYFYCDTLQEPDTISLQSCVSPTSSCDTFFTIRFDVLGGPIELDTRCGGDGTVIFEWKDPRDSGYSAWSKQLQLFEEKENLDWIAEWEVPNGARQTGKNIEWVVSQSELESGSVDGETTDVILDIFILYKGDVFCSSRITKTFNLADNFPVIDRIEGPEKFCLGDVDLSFQASYTDPLDPQHDEPADRVATQLWTIPQGFSFQMPTNASSDTIRLLAPENNTISDPFVCFSVQTGDCQFVAERCKRIDRQQVDIDITALDQCGQYFFAATLQDSVVSRGYSWSIEGGELIGSDENSIVVAQANGPDSAVLRVEVESDCEGIGELEIPPSRGAGVLTDLDESVRSLYRRSCLGSSLYVITESACSYQWGYVDTLSQSFEFPILDDMGNPWNEAYIEVPDSVPSSRLYFVERVLNCSPDDCESELIQLRSSTSLPCDDYDDVILFPNPNRGRFSIQSSSLSSGHYLGQVFSMDGRSIYEQTFNVLGSSRQIDFKIPSLTSGKFLFVLSGPNGFYWQTSIIIMPH